MPKPIVATTIENTAQSPSKTNTAQNPIAASPDKADPRTITMPSIKDALKKLGGRAKTDDNAEPENENTHHAIIVDEPAQEKPFTRDILLTFWLEYMVKLEKEEPRLFSALYKQELPIINDSTISIRFRNNAQKDSFRQTHKSQLLSFLREKLSNSRIEFEETILDDNETPEKKHFSAIDKLKFMAEKNPAIQKLQKDFNLDFE